MKAMQHRGLVYELVRGSDVIRDGMFLELAAPDGRQLAEVFYSDASRKFTLTYSEKDLDLELIEWLIAESKLALPIAILE